MAAPELLLEAFPRNDPIRQRVSPVSHLPFTKLVWGSEPVAQGIGVWSSSSGTPSRCHSHCCSLFRPTRTGSAGSQMPVLPAVTLLVGPPPVLSTRISRALGPGSRRVQDNLVQGQSQQVRNGRGTKRYRRRGSGAGPVQW